MAKLEDIEGIGPNYANKLRAAGIGSQKKLLEAGSTPAGRRRIQKDTGLSAKLVLKWVNRADLARVRGVGEEYADLLEVAGVDTVPELARRNAQNLYERMSALNASRKLVRAIPPLAKVQAWTLQAKDLPRAIHY